MSEDTSEIKEQQKQPVDKRLLDATLRISEDNGEELLDLLLEVNSQLLSNPDFQRGSFINKDTLKEHYTEEFKRVRNLNNLSPSFYVTLGDGLHRLQFNIDREYPEENSVILGHSYIPDAEVEERWKELTTLQEDK